MTSKLPRPRALLFDWDNTLIDSWECIHAAINATMAAMDKPLWRLEDTKARVALSLRDTFPQMFGDRWPLAKETYVKSFAAIHLERLAPLPGAEGLVASLAESGLTLGVVSNKTGNFLRAESAQLGWDRYFHRLVGAGDAEADKPQAAPVFMALDGSGIKAGPDVWFIGDAPIDMACARNAGCSAILLREEPLEDKALTDCPPDRWLGKISDLITILQDVGVPISRN